MKKNILYTFILLFIFACNNEKKPPEKEMNIDQKIDLLTEKINKDTENAKLLFERAKLFYKKKKYNLAKIDIEKSTEIDDKNYDALLFAGDLNWKITNSKGAIFYFNKCINIQRNDVEPYIKLANIYMILGKRTESFSYIEDILTIDNTNHRAYFLKAKNYEEMGKDEKALFFYEEAIKNKPDFYEAYLLCGLILMKNNDDRALDYFNKALKIKPQSEEALYAKAYFFQQKEKINEAQEIYQEILDINPDNIKSNYNLGYINYKNEEYDKAIQFFSTAISKDDKYFHAYYGRAKCYLELDNKEMTINDLEIAQKLKPEDEEINKLLKTLKK